jgi:hypothetical protein
MMKRKVENWSVEKLHKQRTLISFPEYQRQDNLWSEEKKSLLIDSILKNIDIPKLYFNRTIDSNYEVVDGQQRLWAIWQFLDDVYPLKTDGKGKFSDLGRSAQDTITEYVLQVSVLEEAEDEYLRELFIRLQLGLLLITGEKLNALSGRMKDFVFKELAHHRFIRSLGIPKRRFARETLCAQICINAFSRVKNNSFSRTRYEDLQYFFREYEHPKGNDLQFFKELTEEISRVLNELWKCFGDRTKDLKNRSYVLSVYFFFEELLKEEKVSSPAKQKEFAKFVFTLWKRLREEVKAGFERTNKELYTFETLVSSAPGEKYQIERRHEKLRENYEHFVKTGRILGDKA